jgi:hypothetical protein
MLSPRMECWTATSGLTDGTAVGVGVDQGSSIFILLDGSLISSTTYFRVDFFRALA